MLLIRTTLIYAAVFAVLPVAAYVVGALLFENFLAPFVADVRIADVLSAVVVVALFLLLRRRVQSALDRRLIGA